MKKRIKYTMISPVSHIGETASVGSYFQTVTTSSGKIPVLTGNSIRGRLRDSMALHLLNKLDIKLSKDVFNIFFSGGNINGVMRDDMEKAKQIRKHFPMISLLGGGLGDMIMSGKLICSFAYPICQETEMFTGISSFLSWHNLIDEIDFARVDNSKDDMLSVYLKDIEEQKTAKSSTQMRFSVQYMAAGTEFSQDFIFLDRTTNLELGAFYAGMVQWFNEPHLGGMAAKGFGLFDAEMEDGSISVKNNVISLSAEAQKLIADYEDFVLQEGTDYLALFETKKEKKNGKKSDTAD